MSKLKNFPALSLIFLNLLVSLSSPLPGQLVQVRPDDAHYCERVEPLKPNLNLSSSTYITGSVRDQTGDPFKNSQIELRAFVSEKQQTPLLKVMTDDKGRFDLGEVKAGRYRLLASP